MTDSLFTGLKVIDCASWIAGPAAATMLSDFGADVIKIEPPGAGDPVARFDANPGKKVDYYWQLSSRNKRSLALDLKHPDGQAVLHRLVDVRRCIHYQLSASGARSAGHGAGRSDAAKPAPDLRVLHRIRRRR